MYVLETHYVAHQTGRSKELLGEDQRKRVIKNGVLGKYKRQGKEIEGGNPVLIQ
jgi:hypothetical protein